MKRMERLISICGSPGIGRGRLISIKIPVPLLSAFKAKAKAAGVPYQTMIKRLMLAWLKEH